MTNSPATKIAQALHLMKEAQAELSVAVREDKTAGRGKLNSDLWKLSKMQTQFPQYFSNAGQDMFLDQYLFQTKRSGTFVDVGAYDGVTGSNTLFFEVFRGWNGVLIEPVPHQLERAVTWRKAPAFGYAVGVENDDAEFMTVIEGYTQMSGFTDTYDTDLLKQVRAKADHKERLATLPRRRLPEILDEAGLSSLDLLCLSVRGGEREILETMDFTAFDVQTVCVDNPAHDKSLWEMMKRRGYRLLEFLGNDEIYSKSEIATVS